MSVDSTHPLGSAAPTLSISLDAFCIDVNGTKALHSTDPDNPSGSSYDDEGSSDDSKEEDNSDNDEADPEFSKLIATLPEFMHQRLVSLHQSKADLHSIVMDSGRRPYACAPGLKSMFFHALVCSESLTLGFPLLNQVNQKDTIWQKKRAPPSTFTRFSTT